jgi:precorrin-6Y C5,15-methyltransferase (decarboxylating)
MSRIVIIGISDTKPDLTEKQKKLLAGCSHFAGGKRHYSFVAPFLPKAHAWTNITVPLSDLLDKIRTVPEQWVIFASGDPWFFGIANTLKRTFPAATIEVFPIKNSLQALGHRLGINYGLYKTISLTGRLWQDLDNSLITGEQYMGVLTDRKKTPAVIAKRLLDYGYAHYRMHYGQHLGGDKERVVSLTLTEALEFDYEHPNCLFLEKQHNVYVKRWIPEDEFALLNNRPNMITKMPVRLATLGSMTLESKRVFWDIGACTGSISIEARLSFPHLQVLAFELYTERLQVMEENCRRFQCPGIQMYNGDYSTIVKEALAQPDAVFLGGYCGKMEQILDDVAKRLPPKGVIAFNSVTANSERRFEAWAQHHRFTIVFKQLIRVASHNPIQIITIRKDN